MDAYEATKMVFSRIQALDPDNAATVMGVLLIQDPGEQEMIRLAFGPDSLLRAVINDSINKHRNHHQPLVTPPPAASPPFFSTPSDFVVDDDDGALMCGGLHNAVVGPRGGPMMTAAPGPDHAGGRCLFFSRGYCKNGPACRFFHHHHHACIPPPMQTAGAGGGGAGNTDYNEAAADDNDYYYHPHPHSNTTHATLPRLIPTTTTTNPHLPPPPASFAAPSPKSSSLTTLNHILRLQHLHRHRLLQRAEDDEAAANAAATLRLLNMRAAGHYPSSSPPTSPDLMLSPASRQIYLTFPADSTFTEEDVSNYFAIYGPVQDVRIPYQQKRMFGFVSFVYPETVRMVLAKGNPHFVCDSRVLVKPYKEKPKLRDTNRKQLMSMISERTDLSAAAIDNDSAYHQIGFHPLEGSRMMLNGTQEAAAVLLRRRMLEEDHHHQQAAANVTALHHAIELQRKRFSGLQMLDLNHRDVSSSVPMQPVSSLPDSSIFDPPAADNALSSRVTHPASAAAAAASGQHHLPCNETDQGSCLLPGSDSFASDLRLPTEEALGTEDSHADVADIAKGTLETENTEEDAKLSTDPTKSEVNDNCGVSGLPEAVAEGSVSQSTCLTEGSEQNPPERVLPSPPSISSIHNPPCTTSEELEFPNPIFPAPWLMSSPASRCRAGRGAVGM